MNGGQDEPERETLPAVEDLRRLLERARDGDPEARPRLREVLDRHPEVWRHFGDLAAHAERAWVELIGGQDDGLKESLARKVADLKAELAGPTPSPLEQLLAERVTATWLQVHYADAAVAQAGGLSLRQADFAARRQDQAHKRYLTAIGALVTVRRLLPAAVATPAAGAAPVGGLPALPISGPSVETGEAALVGQAAVYRLPERPATRKTRIVKDTKGPDRTAC